ncbi:hypothetical protein N0B44_14785 [Roseibacterium beibuensis]|nr:hypothetical protein [Roseibacterium beibuensis]MCS6624182.1 hypothetical protein [Roseibacterium beibuensis]
MHIFVRCFLLLWLAGALTFVIDAFDGGGVFMPSMDWAGGMGWPVFLACLVVGAIADRLAPRSKGGAETLDVLLGPVFFAVGLQLFVFHTIPVTHALLVRDTVTHVYVAASDHPGGVSWCRSALDLQRIPLMQNQVCRLPRAFFDQIEVGDRVAVTGRGSSLGVFPDTVRALGP